MIDQDFIGLAIQTGSSVTTILVTIWLTMKHHKKEVLQKLEAANSSIKELKLNIEKLFESDKEILSHMRNEHKEIYQRLSKLEALSELYATNNQTKGR